MNQFKNGKKQKQPRKPRKKNAHLELLENLPKGQNPKEEGFKKDPRFQVNDMVLSPFPHLITF